MTASLQTYKKVGLPISFIRHLTYKFPIISTQYQDLFDEYYLKSWSASHVLSRIVEGKINEYIVVFRTPRGQLLADASSEKGANIQYWCSFRKPIVETGLPAVVMISYKG